jgi:hypothetical protein
MNIPPQLRADLAQRLLFLDGQPFSLGDYPFYHDIYNGNYQGMLLKSGRQVAKSTTLCNFLISEAVGTAHFRSLYISPSQEQTRKFSNTRVGKVCLYSPLIKQYWVDASELSQRTMLRMFRNGSEISFTYALDDPDRARGNTADRTCYDEVQDILYEPVIPVINECFDAMVEVLTTTGWKPVHAVTEQDQIADVSPEGVIHWHRPTQVIQRQHSGTMYTFTHTGMHLRVTDNHTLWVNLQDESRSAHFDTYQFLSARDLMAAPGESFRFTGPNGTTAKAPPASRHFDGIPTAHGANRTGITLPYTAFARLVGWYLAEGSIIWTRKNGKRSCPRPCITQSDGRYLDDILKTVEACGLSCSVESNSKKPWIKRVVINSRLLGEYFLPLGKTAAKTIPSEFFEYPALLETLLESLYLGAAASNNATWDYWTLYTVSSQLADDVHRAWTLLGRSPQVRRRDAIPGQTGYEVCAYTDNFFIFYRRQHRVLEETVKDETVYCFTVPFHRPVVRGGFGQRPIVTSQCMGNSEYGYETYAGTPKTMENTIEYLWSISTQNEWIMKCDGCNRWSFIDTARAVGKTGPICVKCGHSLNPRQGQWYSFKPEATLTGFHIPQLILPRNAEQPNRWQRILTKLSRYSETKFKNEVLGVSDALGARIISKQELEALCEDYDVYRQPLPGTLENYQHIVAGVDWSGGGTEGISRTVVWIWAVTKDHRLRTLYFRIYPVTSPVSVVDDVAEALQIHNVELVVGDRGEGHLANDLLAQRLGQNRVTQVMYGSQARAISWNDKGAFYTVDRTTLMDNYFMVLKRQGVIFPRLACMGEPIADTLNIYEEVTTSGKKVWRHAPTQPDDCFHAQLFGWLGAKVLLMDLNFKG